MAVQLGVDYNDVNKPTYKSRFNSLTDVDLLANVDYLVKEMYTADAVEDLTIKDHPFMAMVSKSTDFYGDVYPVPVMYGRNNGVSRVLSNAQSNRSNHNGARFQLTRRAVYGTAEVYTETLRAMSNDKGAFANVLTMELDSTFEAVSASVAKQLFEAGYGLLADCTIDTDATSDMITLSNAEDSIQFEVGMVLDIITEATDTLAANYSASDAKVRSPAAGKGDITSINRDTGVINIDVNTDINTTYTDNPVDTSGSFTCALALNGDASVTSTALNLTRVAGLASWLPTTAPSSGDNHFFVDRSVDTQRLAGIRYDGSSDPIEEAILNALAVAARYGARPSVVFMNPARYNDLVKALGAKVQYVETGVTGTVGFSGLQIFGVNGAVKVYADQDCPVNRAFALELDKWELKSLGEMVGFLSDGDGLRALRESSTDSYEWRVGGYMNLCSKAPGRNINITLPT